MSESHQGINRWNAQKSRRHTSVYDGLDPYMVRQIGPNPVILSPNLQKCGRFPKRVQSAASNPGPGNQVKPRLSDCLRRRYPPRSAGGDARHYKYIRTFGKRCSRHRQSVRPEPFVRIDEVQDPGRRLPSTVSRSLLHGCDSRFSYVIPYASFIISVPVLRTAQQETVVEEEPTRN